MEDHHHSMLTSEEDGDEWHGNGYRNWCRHGHGHGSSGGVLGGGGERDHCRAHGCAHGQQYCSSVGGVHHTNSLARVCGHGRCQRQEVHDYDTIASGESHPLL